MYQHVRVRVPKEERTVDELERTQVFLLDDGFCCRWIDMNFCCQGKGALRPIKGSKERDRNLLKGSALDHGLFFPSDQLLLFP